MISFKKILVTTDLSTNSEAAIPYAMDIARQYKGELLIVHAFEFEPFVIAGGGADPTMMTAEGWESVYREQHAKFLTCVDRWVKDTPDVRFQSHFLRGQAVQQVIELADKEKVDLIVLATHGRTGLAHFFYGSVAEKIVRFSHHPVLSIRPPSLAKVR